MDRHKNAAARLAALCILVLLASCNNRVVTVTHVVKNIKAMNKGMAALPEDTTVDQGALIADEKKEEQIPVNNA